MSDHIVLFDMDGTLTPARKPITPDVLNALRRLTRFRRSKVGVVTGSGLDYLVEQCNPIWTEIGSCYAADVVLMPCNGTQVYTWDKSIGTFAEAHTVSMAKKLKKKKYKKLITELLNLQLSLMADHELPLTGEFISYRKSLVNWCPVGRSAGDEEREAFIEYDNTNSLRQLYLERLVDYCSANKINVTCL